MTRPNFYVMQLHGWKGLKSHLADGCCGLSTHGRAVAALFTLSNLGLAVTTCKRVSWDLDLLVATLEVCTTYPV